MTPDGWRRGPVSALGEVVAGKAKNQDGGGALRPYLRVANVFDGRIDISHVLEMPFSDAEFVRYQVRHGDVLLNEGQSLELVGRCAMYRGEYPGPCAIQNALVRFRAGAAITPSYAEQLFRRCQTVGIFAEIATQTTSIAHLGVKRFAELELVIPPLSEQRKIAAILTAVDEAIEATQAVIEQLQVVKKAMMAELLTRGLPGRHTRFKQTEIGEVPDEWEVDQLGNIANLVTSGSRGWASYYAETGALFLRITNLQRGTTRLDLENRQHVRLPTGSAEGTRTRVRPGDVLISITADLGIVGLVDSAEEAYVNQHIALVRLDQRRVDPRFVAWALAGDVGVQQVRRLNDAGAKAGLSLPNIRRLMIPIPELAEQGRLVEIIERTEDRLILEQQSVSGLRGLRSALMSVLLTGEVRVKPDPEPA